MRSVFIPVKSAGSSHNASSGHNCAKGNPRAANKFSASVKQAWKTKKIVSKMRRKSLVQPAQSRLAARRTGVLGLGLPGFPFGGAPGGSGSWTAGGSEGNTSVAGNFIMFTLQLKSNTLNHILLFFRLRAR